MNPIQLDGRPFFFSSKLVSHHFNFISAFGIVSVFVAVHWNGPISQYSRMGLIKSFFHSFFFVNKTVRFFPFLSTINEIEYVLYLFIYFVDFIIMAFFTGATKDQMRADQLVKRRQQEHEQMEMKKKKIEEENRMQTIEEKFKAHYDAVEQMLKSDTVGLVSLDEMKKKQEEIIQAREQQLAREKEAKLGDGSKNKQDNRKDAHGHRKPTKLSFADEWDEEEEEEEEEEEKKEQVNRR